MGIETDMRDFAKSLAPDERQKAAYKRVIARVKGILDNSLKPDRVVATGSFGKATGIKFSMDLDIVFFLNDKDPPYEAIIRRTEEVIRQQLCRTATSNKFLVNFILIEDGFTCDVDLLPAKNMTKGGDIGQAWSKELARRQYLRTIEHMETVRKNLRFEWSKGLTETSVNFVKEQSAGVHELIRVAKCWLFAKMKKVPLGGYSSAIETIAIYAGQQVERQPGLPFDISDAFQLFLQYMSNINNNMKIYFDEEFMHNKPYTANYRREDIPTELLQQQPLLLDTVDYMNNRLERLKAEDLVILARGANESLQRIREGRDIEAIMNPDPESEFRRHISNLVEEVKFTPHGRNGERKQSFQIRLLSHLLAPSSEQKRVLNTIIFDINDVLSKHLTMNDKRVCFDRIRQAGSYAKGTGVNFNMDLDIVCFFNDAEPPFARFLQEIVNCVRQRVWGVVNVKPIGEWSQTAECTIKRDGFTFSVDLVPAKNMAKGNKNVEGTANLQYRKTMELMKSLSFEEDKLRCMYSAGLSETSVNFIKAQSGSIHELIRLAKCWLLGSMEEKLPGGYSSAIETIAVYAGQKEEKKPNSSFEISKAFKIFLNLVRNIDNNMRIVFDTEFMKNKDYVANYSRSDIPSDVYCEEPLLLDTADCFNNRLHRLMEPKTHKPFLKFLAERARKTLIALENQSPLNVVMRPHDDSAFRNEIFTALSNYRG